MIRILKKYTRDRSGFSFAELMVVIALIGILSAIALPSFLRGLPEKRLKNAARNLYADMQRARMLAVQQNRSIPVRFNLSGNFYYFDESNKTDPGYEKWDNDEFRRDLSEAGAVSFGFGKATKNWDNDPLPTSPAPDETASPLNDRITFGSTGTASSRSVFLQNENKNVCYAITVTNYGFVNIRMFNGTVWDKD